MRLSDTHEDKTNQDNKVVSLRLSHKKRTSLACAMLNSATFGFLFIASFCVIRTSKFDFSRFTHRSRSYRRHLSLRL